MRLKVFQLEEEKMYLCRPRSWGFTLVSGPNVVHWRDTFIGDYSYHMFLHYFSDRCSRLNNFGEFHIDHGLAPPLQELY